MPTSKFGGDQNFGSRAKIIEAENEDEDGFEFISDAGRRYTIPVVPEQEGEQTNEYEDTSLRAGSNIGTQRNTGSLLRQGTTASRGVRPVTQIHGGS